MVNWDAIGAIGETIGAIAVVITLLFLVRQIKQASEGQSAAAFTNWAQMRIGVTTAWSQREVAQTVIGGLLDPHSLKSDEDRLVFHNHMHQLMITWEVTFRLWKKGLLTDTDWLAGRQMISEINSAPAFALWWPSVSDYYDPEFVELVNATEGVSMGYDNFVAKLEDSGT